jgi:DNA-binding MarR family transcriptional regulator
MADSTTDRTIAVLATAIAALRERERGDGGQPAAESDMFHEYFHGIAEAHYVIRKVLRLVDEQAKRAGLDPLEHKMLIQIFGAGGERLRINEAAARLDIPPALSSRLVKRLQDKGFVVRSTGNGDRRTTQVATTDAGRAALAAIDRGVRRHVEHFQEQLSDAERAAALQIFAFYLGASPPSA